MFLFNHLGSKQLTALLFLSSFFGYLEWGDNASFLFEVEWELIQVLVNDPMSAMHPFTVLPMLGQIGLVVALFQKSPTKWLVYASIGCLGLLFGLMFFIGIAGWNLKILGSTLPFLILSVLVIVRLRRQHP